jgi:AbrB family looped-hinge helix DNA binding protein
MFYKIQIMAKLARVSSKGQVVIPAPLRKALKIKRTVIIRREGGKIVLEPSSSMEEAFGTGGKEMVMVAIEIIQDRRKEVESER